MTDTLEIKKIIRMKGFTLDTLEKNRDFAHFIKL